MEEYLTSTLDKLNTNNYAGLNIVIGNESCDLDSAISSIVYAAFLHWQYNQIKCKVCTKTRRVDHKEDIFIPILNVDRQDYALKTEVVYCLREQGINETQLIFRDDHDLKSLIEKSKTEITIVDHHTLAKKDNFLTPYVTEIIDHRPLDKTEWKYKDDTRSTIEVVGSCCTLVGRRIKDLSALMSKGAEFFNAYPKCARMLHSTIILDTVNFSKDLDKTTPHDVEIVQFLENILKPSDFETERNHILEQLVKARKDVSSLTAAQLLRKDVKLVGYVLVPTFPILVKEFLEKPQALEAVIEALNKRGCSIALLLGMDLTGGLKRDLAVYATDCNRINQLCSHLESWGAPPLQLSAPAGGGGGGGGRGGVRGGTVPLGCSYFLQLNLAASRKQYVPAIIDYLNKNLH